MTLAVRAYPLLRTQRPTSRAGASPARVGRPRPARRSWSRECRSSADGSDLGGESCQARRPGGAATVAAVAAAPTACNSGGGGGSAGVVDDRGGGAGGGIRHGGTCAASCGHGVRQIAIEDAEAQHHELGPRSRGRCCVLHVYGARSSRQPAWPACATAATDRSDKLKRKTRKFFGSMRPRCSGGTCRGTLWRLRRCVCQ